MVFPLANTDTTRLLANQMRPALDQAISTIEGLSAQWATLSPADKQSFANYLKVNKASIDALTADAQDLVDFTQDPQNGFNRASRVTGSICYEGTIPTRYKCYADVLSSHLKDVLFFGSVSALAVLTIPGPVGLALAAVPAAAGTLGFVRLFVASLSFLRYNFYVVKIVVLNLFTMIAGRGMGDEVLFIKDLPKTLPFKVHMRNLQPTDASSSISWIKDLVILIDKYNNFLGKLGVERFKWVYQPLNIKEYQPLALSYLSVTKITNPAVTNGVIEGTVSAPTLKFTTNSTTDQLFKFDLNYNDGINKSISVTVDGKLTSSFAGITVAGGNGSGSALNQIKSRASALGFANGTLYIFDKGNRRVLRWPIGSAVGSTALSYSVGGHAEFHDMYVSSSGGLYTSAGIDRVMLNGSIVAGILYTGGSNQACAGLNTLCTPQQICVDNAGNIYIAEAVVSSQFGQVVKWAPGATSGVVVVPASALGLAETSVSGMTVDNQGNLYISDGSRVRKFPSGSGTGVIVAGGNGEGAAANQLAIASGLDIDANGNIYIADAGNHRVQKWAPGATSGVTVAGGNGQGAGANQLYYPNDVKLDGAGYIYVLDEFNHRVQKWAL